MHARRWQFFTVAPKGSSSGPGTTQHFWARYSLERTSLQRVNSSRRAATSSGSAARGCRTASPLAAESLAEPVCCVPACARPVHPTVLAGDYNVVPTDADIYATRSFKDNALLQPEPRAAFQQLMQAGWTDALHTQSPEKPIYTFWSYKRNRWARDAGMRIDHLLLSPAAARRMHGAGVDRGVRGLEDASDHAPAWVVLD